jgi:hypothetical protein
MANHVSEVEDGFAYKKQRKNVRKKADGKKKAERATILPSDEKPELSCLPSPLAVSHA